MFTFGSKGKTIARISKGKMKGEILSICNESSEREKCYETVTLDSASFEPIPSCLWESKEVKPVREICYICGASGAGKSTWVAKYAFNFHKIFPKNKIFLISRLDSDEALDDLDIIRVPIDDKWLIKPRNIHEDAPNGSLFIFDDTDTIPDKLIREAVSKLMMDILETGRHKNIYCLITSHIINREKRVESTRIFNESHRVVIFPKSGNRQSQINMLKNHIGLSSKNANEILNMKSRWVCIGKTYPQYILTVDAVAPLS